jgi:PadR family transcriptional regulator PadR
MPPAARQTRHLPAFLLLTLAEGPLHGHGIRAALEELLPGYKADAGATYRTLNALEASGEVTSQWATESKGPARKVYTLTPEGWAQLDRWKVDMEQRLGYLQTFLERHAQAKALRPRTR